jgi:hypothetical protein
MLQLLLEIALWKMKMSEKKNKEDGHLLRRCNDFHERERCVFGLVTPTRKYISCHSGKTFNKLGFVILEGT